MVLGSGHGHGQPNFKETTQQERDMENKRKADELMSRTICQWIVLYIFFRNRKLTLNSDDGTMSLKHEH